MCSQPPVSRDDGWIVGELLKAIPLMDRGTREVGITGGEPTLLHEGLVKLLVALRDHLPDTAAHVLTNGRLFSYLKYAEMVAGVKHPDLMFGIPIYADTPERHDFVVQARGAFDETVRGILNLTRFGVRVEVRVVLHAQTVSRLPQLARWLCRNMPFVDHVALMGLEMTGYTRLNLEALWIDPIDYARELESAVHLLAQSGLTVSIYNHPLCLLEPSLWPFARKSISDWKNVYVPECEGCAARSECGGFFASSELRRSAHIRAVRPEGMPQHR
jgi:His-Xaa-Ser system radical SAM maturase HxsC